MIKKLEIKYRYGFNTRTRPIFQTKPGLSKNIVKDISNYKQEPEYMLKLRIQAYDIFTKLKMPDWGVDLSKLELNKIVYFSDPTKNTVDSWEKLPQNIKDTYDKIGVPKQERNFLAGVSAQFDSKVVYKNYQKYLAKKNIIFCDMETAINRYPNLVKQYYAKLVPLNDNKFAALNSALWSGGTFLYVPKNTRIDLPLQAYFRINAVSFGQFERTLIIADQGSSVHYIEGCTAPIYRTSSLHAAVVEVFALKNAHVRYTTIQNWSNNIYNLVTKRAKAEENAIIEWLDCNIGSKATMKYPAIILNGDNSKGEILSLAYAGKNQHQDNGGKIYHIGKNTTSKILSKSISKSGGITNFRGLVKVKKGAIKTRSHSNCDAIILDDKSISNTYPLIKTEEKNVILEHEATVNKLDIEKLHYIMSRGVDKNKAQGLIVNGFIKPISKQLPLEYSVELYRLINFESADLIG